MLNMLRRATIILIAGFLLTASSAGAQRGPGRMVESSWLARHLEDPDLVLLHVGDQEGYNKEHLPGARFVTRNEFADPASVTPEAEPRLELPTPAHLDSVLEAMGISDDSEIVVYWGSDWVTPSTRIVFTLDYVGLKDRTHVLNGGMSAWKEEGLPTTTEVPGPAPRGNLTPHPHPEIVVDHAWVQAHLADPGTRIVDCRDAVFFTADPERPDPMYGHLPGAVSIPFVEMMGDDLRLKSEKDLRAIFREAGVREGQQIVTYCHIGQQASLVRMVADLLGFQVRFYDGSFHDWLANKLPVEGGSGGEHGSH